METTTFAQCFCIQSNVKFGTASGKLRRLQFVFELWMRFWIDLFRLYFLWYEIVPFNPHHPSPLKTLSIFIIWKSIGCHRVEFAHLQHNDFQHFIISNAPIAQRNRIIELEIFIEHTELDHRRFLTKSYFWYGL